MNSSDLFKILSFPCLERGELESILAAHFGSARLQDDEIIFPNEPAKYVLKIRYDENGELIAIEDGPSFTDAVLEVLSSKIKAEAASTELGIGNIVLFSHVPLKNWWKYKDIFQILPVPPNAPTLGFLMGDHPFLLQFHFRRSKDSMVGMARKQRESRKLSLLLHLFLEGSVIEQSFNTRFHWVVLPPDESKKPMQLRSAFYQGSYFYEGYAGEVDAFSPVDGIAALTMVDPVQYYSRHGVSSAQVLEAPRNLKDLFDRFFQLSLDLQDKFLRACYWFRHSLVVWYDSNSASYSALVQAIEVLLPNEATEVCSECEKPKEGAVKKFQGFLDKFAPYKGGVTQGRKELYAIRSRISHGYFLFDRDQFPIHWGLSPQTQGQNEAWNEMRQIARTALINWLYSQT